MENAISLLAKSQLILSLKSQEPIKPDGLMEGMYSVLLLFEKQPEIPVVLFRLPNTSRLQNYKKIEYSRVFI